MAVAAAEMANSRFLGVGLNQFGETMNQEYTVGLPLSERSLEVAPRIYRWQLVETVYLMIASECGWITLAVFLMLFLFISTVCFAAAAVIGFVRSLTIALENRRVYGDLRRLGASADWMRRSARSQVRRVFTVPTAAGIGLMYAFYGMIMFFNDGSFTAGELAGLVSCLGLAAAVAAAADLAAGEC